MQHNNSSQRVQPKMQIRAFPVQRKPIPVVTQGVVGTQTLKVVQTTNPHAGRHPMQIPAGAPRQRRNSVVLAGPPNLGPRSRRPSIVSVDGAELPVEAVMVVSPPARSPPVAAGNPRIAFPVSRSPEYGGAPRRVRPGVVVTPVDPAVHPHTVGRIDRSRDHIAGLSLHTRGAVNPTAPIGVKPELVHSRMPAGGQHHMSAPQHLSPDLPQLVAAARSPPVAVVVPGLKCPASDPQMQRWLAQSKQRWRKRREPPKKKPRVRNAARPVSQSKQKPILQPEPQCGRVTQQLGLIQQARRSGEQHWAPDPKRSRHSCCGAGPAWNRRAAPELPNQASLEQLVMGSNSWWVASEEGVYV